MPPVAICSGQSTAAGTLPFELTVIVNHVHVKCLSLCLSPRCERFSLCRAAGSRCLSFELSSEDGLAIVGGDTFGQGSCSPLRERLLFYQCQKHRYSM